MSRGERAWRRGSGAQKLVTEAGGRSERFGRQWLSTNGLLHDAVTAVLG